jgi:putative DNA-invertase from lambdoid prophage Rac
MKIALYARVSTREQNSIPMQLDAMREYCKQRGWEIVIEVSEARSGKLARPRRDELIQMARKRLIDGVIVWKLNRWGRSTVDIILTINELLAWGVAFVSISENLDFSTPMGRLMAGVLAVFAQFERETIVENVKAGIDTYRKKNQKWGRPPATPYTMEKVRRLKGEGRTILEICKEAGVSRASVYRMLK